MFIPFLFGSLINSVVNQNRKIFGWKELPKEPFTTDGTDNTETYLQSRDLRNRW